MNSQILLMISLLWMACGSAFAQTDDGADRSWEFVLEPYLLATSIEGETSLGRISGVPVDVSFSDILDNLDMAGMLNFEAQHKNGWGIIMDYAFMNLSADTNVGFGGVIDAGVRQRIFEGLVSRRLDLAKGDMELYGGIRWWDNRITADFDPVIWPGSPSARIDESWIDPIIGLRWTTPLSKRWKLRLRGDVGGFSVGSSFTWSGAATALFRMTERLELQVGYRAVGVDYDNGKAPDNGFFEYNTTTHGPLVGLKIEF